MRLFALLNSFVFRLISDKLFSILLILVGDYTGVGVSTWGSKLVLLLELLF